MTYKPEIERKFLVRSFPIDILQDNECSWIEQGYLRFKRAIRVRASLLNPYAHVPTSIHLVPDGPTIKPHESEWQGTITMKDRAVSGDWRTQMEREDSIDPEFVWELLRGAPSVRKARYVIGRFELDIYTKPQLRGLVVMEIELQSADEQVDLPDGFDAIEVTEDSRFRSAMLAQIKTSKELKKLLSEYGVQIKGGG